MGRPRDKSPARRIAPRARSRGFSAREFFKALRACDYDRCRELATGDSPAAIFAASRLAIRERRYLDVIGWLSGTQAASRADALERDVLLGAALGLTRDFVAGKRLLDDALQRLPKRGLLIEDARYYRAAIAWVEHDHRTAERVIAPNLVSEDPNRRAGAHIMLSWIAVRRYEIETHIRELEAALDETEDAPERDELYRAVPLLTLSVLCREISLPKTLARVRSVYDSTRWNNGIVREKFQTTRMLALCDALEGNELGAFGRLRVATSLAPSEFWRVMCLLDRAQLAKRTGERAFGMDMLHDAHELAAGLQWETTVGEERAALTVLAEMFASIDPSISQRYLALHRSLPNTSALLAYSSDPRARAFEAYGAGMAQLHLGDRTGAANLLLEVWSILNDFHYGWRAGLCALGLFEATGDPQWLERAARRVDPWPRSWVARMVATASASVRTQPELPAVQRQVLELLRAGKRNAEIAAVLGRSPHTVRNHVAQLFKTYGVRTRGELAAAAALQTPS